jgi:hypothetical protein
MAKTIKTPRRMTPAQSATAAGAGIPQSEIQGLAEDNGDRIVVVEVGKSKGGNTAGYMVQLHDGDGNIINMDMTLYPKATTAIAKGREQWESAQIDEGKALRSFFAQFTLQWNDFVGSTKNNRLGEAAVLDKLMKLYAD